MHPSFCVTADALTPKRDQNEWVSVCRKIPVWCRSSEPLALRERCEGFLFFHANAHTLFAMKTLFLPNTTLSVTRLAYGCMGIGGNWSHAPMSADERKRAARVVTAALEQGITFFDHADIYCHGKSEMVFGEIMRDMKITRESIFLQSKCGIRFPDEPRAGDPLRFDYSYEHIIEAVRGSLKRLQTDYLDVLLLHRPDALVEPEEVARAFEELHSTGQVKHFGVSNHTFAQIELLKKFVVQPLVVNQLEVSLLHADLIDDGMFFNTAPRPYTGIGGTLEYCRKNDILIQAWGPVAKGLLLNPPADAPQNVQEVAALLVQMARAKNTSPEAIAYAWLLKHPAGFQPIIGTTNPDRVAASCLADEIELTRQEWYSLLKTARGRNLP